MNLDHAKYFLTLSETQHIQKAAHILGISSTAISHGVAKLEEELDVQLTAKSGRNIILTEKGIEFARKIRPLLGELENVKASLGGDVLISGHYKMAFTHNLFPVFRNKNIFEIVENNSDVTLELQSKRSGEVVSSIADGTVDFGFCLSPLDHPDLERKVIHKGKLVFVARKKHPIFKVTKMDEKVRMLNESPAVGSKAARGVENCESHPSFKKLKITPNFKYVTDAYDINLSILRDTNSWAFVPDFYLEEHPWLQEIKLSDTKAHYTIEAVWNKNRTPLRFYNMILENLIETLALSHDQ